MGATAAAAAIGVGLGGCGPASQGGSSLASAVGATTHTRGAKIGFVVNVASTKLSHPVRMTGGGVIDLSSGRAELRFDLSGLAGLGGSKVSPAKLQATEILDGTVIYMRIPLLDGRLPGRKTWVKFDLKKAFGSLGLDLGPALQAGQDPTRQLDYLRTVADAKKVGSDRVRGVATTRYHGDLRLDRYPSLLPRREQAAARAAVQRLIKGSGSSSIPVDVWIDGRNRVRRMSVSMTVRPASAPGQSLRMQIDEDLYAFGAKVVVSAPLAKDVYDATGVFSKALGSAKSGG